jgi:Ca2+-binding RTX toxin-like protein
MCVVCDSYRPWSQDCAYAAGDVGEVSGQANAAHVTLSDAEIGQRLIDDEGTGPRAFDVRAGDTLTYDVTRLTAEGKALARAAMDEWATVTGLEFAEVSGGLRPEARLVERTDLPASTRTGAEIGLNQVFDGTIGAGDRDWVRVELPASGVVKFSVQGIGKTPLDNPSVSVFTGSGKALQIGARHYDDRAEFYFAIGGGGGTYHAQVQGLGGGTGTYRLAVHDPDAAGVPDIVFDDERPGAFATYASMKGQVMSAHVNVSETWIASYGDEVGTYGFQTYLHEVGHALGLSHPGNYGGDAQFARDAEFANDSWQTSVMSYFNQYENPNVEGNRAYTLTPMSADIHAVRELYGRADIRDGDTTYGHNSTAGGTLDRLDDADGPVAFTIADTGGRDRLDLSREREGQRVDLTPGSVSDVFGERGNMTISTGSYLEEVRGGSGDDYVKGNRADNVLRGGDGDDTLLGKDGDDTLSGGAGRDKLAGGSGDDVLTGGSGKDKLKGDGGADVFVLARGFDKDVVKDFDPGEGDRIDLRAIDAVTSWRDLRDNHLRDKGDKLVLKAGDDGKAKFADVDLSDLSAGDFLFG